MSQSSTQSGQQSALYFGILRRFQTIHSALSRSDKLPLTTAQLPRGFLREQPPWVRGTCIRAIRLLIPHLADGGAPIAKALRATARHPEPSAPLPPGIGMRDIVGIAPSGDPPAIRGTTAQRPGSAEPDPVEFERAVIVHGTKAGRHSGRPLRRFTGNMLKVRVGST
jgi:hypothetical protein